MIQKVANSITITCQTIDFTTATNIEVYLKQAPFFKTYSAIVINSHSLGVNIPKEDAMSLDHTRVQLQFACTINGASVVSNIVCIPVEELLKEAGYGN